MELKEFDFELPEELIAQYPSQKRDEANLMVVHFISKRFEHRKFKDIVHYLNPGDILVLNNTKVIKARLYCRREDTGGKVEFLFLNPIDEKTFIALAKPSRKAKIGLTFKCGEGRLEITGYKPGRRIVKIISHETIDEFLNKYGVMPLPPYIKREAKKEDEQWYQTVYAERPGSIAAPTAGLHFTEEILTRLKEKGVEILKITLHVGLGTFKPIRTEQVEEHEMDEEYYEIPYPVALKIKQAKEEGRRVIGVGTTSTRALESWGLDMNKLSGYTDLFIYPGYKYRVIDALITNFHLPKSTPLLLVSALCGIELLKKAYREAIERRYRFFSYGDAMLLIND